MPRSSKIVTSSKFIYYRTVTLDTRSMSIFKTRPVNFAEVHTGGGYSSGTRFTFLFWPFGVRGDARSLTDFG